MRATFLVLPVFLLSSSMAACSRPAPPPAAHAPAVAPVPAPVPAGARTQRPQPGEAWKAFGNEPFWNVEAHGGALVFSTPDDQAGLALQGRRVPSLVGTVILGQGEGGEFHFGVTPGKCSDGMSDRSYDYNATFIYRDRTYRGCAEPL